MARSFTEFLNDFDAIYVHAGGSPQAYQKIADLGLTNLDGANMYLPSTYWRDQWRLYNVGYEHSLMTNGAGIVSGIQYKKYRTTLNAGHVPSLKFCEEGTDNKLAGSAAKHVRMVSTPIQTVDFVYNATTGEYLRYHYNGIAHVDGTTGNQISVKNVFILFTDIAVIPGDASGRVSVTTVGSGTGYYITNGIYKAINWSRASLTSPLCLTYQDGTEVILNCGKTFFCVVDSSAAKTISFNYQW